MLPHCVARLNEARADPHVADQDPTLVDIHINTSAVPPRLRRRVRADPRICMNRSIGTRVPAQSPSTASLSILTCYTGPNIHQGRLETFLRPALPSISG